MIEPFTHQQALDHFRGLRDTAFLGHSRGHERSTTLLEILDALADTWGGSSCSFHKFADIDPATRQILYRLMEARARGTVFRVS